MSSDRGRVEGQGVIPMRLLEGHPSGPPTFDETADSGGRQWMAADGGGWRRREGKYQSEQVTPPA